MGAGRSSHARRVSEQVGRVLAALADDTRRSIVRQLADGASPTATELAQDLPMTRQAVSKHLRILEEAQVVTAERRGRETRYHLRPSALAAAGSWIDDVSAAWGSRLGRLKADVERGADDPAGASEDVGGGGERSAG